MKRPLPMEIHGAGVAGMGLAVLLSSRGIPVKIIDRSTGPQHRVCGEFMRGLNSQLIDQYELSSILHEAPQHRKVAWFFEDKSLLQFDLPEAVYSVGRPSLERYLKKRCEESGVEFVFNERGIPKNEGTVIATGRRRTFDSPWFGFKIHVRNIALRSDLEMHLSPCGYVGLSTIEKGWVNVSGIFKSGSIETEGLKKGNLPIHRMQALLTRMGFARLSDRLEEAVAEPESLKSTSGIVFGFQKSKSIELAIGDAFAFIPPFSGSGMAMALQGAQIAARVIERYSRGEEAWEKVCREVRRELKNRFSKKIFFAQAFHYLMSSSQFQPSLVKIARSGLLPIKPILWGIS